jgi:hypothetical protein
MKLPDDANTITAVTPGAKIENTYFMKQFITENEAIDLISWLACRLVVERAHIPEEQDDDC